MRDLTNVTITKMEKDVRGTLSFKLSILERQLDMLSANKLRDTEYEAVGYTLLNLGFDITVSHKFGSKENLLHKVSSCYDHITIPNVVSAQEFLNKRVVLNNSIGVYKIIETLVFLDLKVTKNDDGSYLVRM